jgi:competence protein ComEC
MRVGGRFIVSDAGQFNITSVDGALRALGADKRIDVAILTHPHSDHVRNFITLVKDLGWTIDTVVLSHSDGWQGTKTNRDLMAELTTHAGTITFVTAGQKFDWGGAEWEILSPPPDKYTGPAQVANSSVVYVVRVDGDQLLFTGDIGESVARTVAERWRSEGLGRVKVFLATHHGSAAGSTSELLDATQPEWAVLSTGKNSFGHPTAAAISRLKQHGVSIWCTNANGTIHAHIADDGTITWDASKQSTPWWSAETKRETGRCVKQ